MEPFSVRLEIETQSESARKIREIAYEVGALLQGEFTLASGRKSNRYFEGKKITLQPEGAYQVGKAIFDELAEAGVDAVGGLATGAYPIATSVAMISHLEGKPVSAFVVREEQKDHGARRLIEGHLQEGSRVAIVDDVITSGGSIIKAIKAVEERNCRVVKVLALVDRHEGGVQKLREMGYDFQAILGFPPE
ncbi:orotate phosphoribosyltransferase [Chloroflexota bacterium]